MEKYLDASLTPEERAEDLLSKMSLEEKIAQAAGIMPYRGMEEMMIQGLAHGIGQVSTLSFRELGSMEEAAAYQKHLQTMIMEKSEHHIPAVFHMEGICGAFIQDSTSFPSGVNRGASFDPELEEKIGEIVSRQELAYGITQILAPVLDISRDSRMGRQSEPYGEDPTLAAAMGTAYVKGIQRQEIAGRHAESAAKHFLGFHNSQGGIHGADVQADDRLLQEIYGKSFQAAIREANLRGVMPCYCSIEGMPIHVNKKFLTDLLREDMGFDGVVVSDYGGVSNAYSVQHASETMGTAGYRALKAGMDVELPMPVAYGRELTEMFKNGEADVAVLDEVVLRILRAKFRMGLFEHPFSLEGAELEETVHHADDDFISRKMAQESIILLKNENNALPLAKDVKTIAVIGPHAANARYYFGGYTHLSMSEALRAAGNSMAGTGGGGNTAEMEMKRVPGTNIQDDESDHFNEVLTRLHPECKNLVQTLAEAFPEAEICHAMGYQKAGADESGFAEALSLVEKADVVILTLGGKNGSGSIATMGEGVDGTNINLPSGQDAFILLAKKYGKPMIGVHFDGRPISSDVADANLDAIVEAFTPAEFAADAVTNVLTGAYNPSGKLPLSVARSAGQIPVCYNHLYGSSWHQGDSIGFADYADMPHRPRYFFGHGLSYTTFAYENLTVNGTLIDQEEISKKVEEVPFAAMRGLPPAPDPFMTLAVRTAPDAAVEASFTVANTGSVSGCEVVQLYISDAYASMTRPVKELMGFARVELAPGEKKRVTFTIQPDCMAFLDEDMKWKVEKGLFRVLIGSSSEDIRLKGSYCVEEDAFLAGRDRSFRAAAKVEAV